MKFFSKLLLVVLLFALSFTSFYKPVFASGEQNDLPAVKDFVPLEVYPEMTYIQKPDYPQKAEDTGVEGIVWVRSLIDREGTVVKSEIGKTSGNEMLDKSALTAAKECKFKPGINNGQPVASWVTYKVTFDLGDCQEDKKIKKE